MKVKITTQIESEMKTLFELTECIHHFGYQEALERGIREILTELNQPKFLDQEILRTQAEIARLSQKQMMLESAKDKLNNLKMEIIENKSNGNGNLDELEKIRDKIFDNIGEGKAREINLSTRRKQWADNQGAKWDWKRIIETYQFKNKTEAVEWFRKKLNGDEVSP